MANMNPAKFVREVKQEIDKVTWPTRRETTVSVLMVFALVAVASIFFVFVDWIIGTLVRALIGI